MEYLNIKRYLEGKTTSEESEQIRNWMLDPENDTELRKALGTIWSNHEIKLKGKHPDFDQIIDHIHHGINTDQIKVQPEKVKRVEIFRILVQGFSRIAAVLFIPLLLLSAYLLLNDLSDKTEVASQTVREIYTKPGIITQIDLPDGTRVWLNDCTRLRYPEVFSGRKREVYLDGEAYFEVLSNPENPFVINSPMANTTVTGTHFNLNAYSDNQFFEATLHEGKITLDKNSQTIAMKPGEQVLYNTLTGKIVKRMVDPANSSAWINGKLVLRDEKLEVALKKIAKRYHVDLVISDPEINNLLLTATIQNETLDQTLRMISSAIPLKYTSIGDSNQIHRKIYFRKK